MSATWKRLAPGIEKYAEPTLRLPGGRSVMGLTVDGDEGVVRVVEQRTGQVDVAGYVDVSWLYMAKRVEGPEWELAGKLEIAGLEAQLSQLQPPGGKLVGLEDPDLVRDPDGLLHCYFTIAFSSKAGENILYLGHASGRDVHSLNSAPTVMSVIREPNNLRVFKELAPAPVNSAGVRLQLVESSNQTSGRYFSTLAVGEATGFDGPWTYRAEVLHPAKAGHPWCAEHVSPCRLLPAKFIDRGDLLVGILNGRSASKAGKYGKFLPGLFLYDSETGSIPWVDERPLFDDLDAKTIVFASEFELSRDDHAILYAHIDDTYIQAYRLDAQKLGQRVPKSGDN